MPQNFPLCCGYSFTKFQRDSFHDNSFEDSTQTLCEKANLVIVTLCTVSDLADNQKKPKFSCTIWRFHLCSIFVTSSVKRLIPITHLTCEFSTTLKLGPNIPLTLHYCLV